MTFEEYLQAGRKAGDKDLLLVEKELSKMYLEAFKDTSRELEVFLAKGFSPEEVRKYGRLAQLLDGIKTEYKKLTGKALDLTITASSDAYLEAFKRYEFALDSVGGVQVGWGMPPVDVIRASVFSDHSGLTLEQIYGKNYTAELARIQGTITRGIIQGKGYAKVAAELKDAFNKGFSDALRVVRTENTRNWTEGALQGFEEAKGMGIDVELVWIAALDSRTRDTHAKLDGQIADKDGLFHIDGMTTEGPGMFGIPEEDINCRCTVSSRLKDIPPDIRRIDGEVQQYKTFAQWAEPQGWTPEKGWPKVKTV